MKKKVSDYIFTFRENCISRRKQMTPPPSPHCCGTDIKRNIPRVVKNSQNRISPWRRPLISISTTKNISQTLEIENSFTSRRNEEAEKSISNLDGWACCRVGRFNYKKFESGDPKITGARYSPGMISVWGLGSYSFELFPPSTISVELTQFCQVTQAFLI